MKTIYDAEGADFAELLLGKSIKTVDTHKNTITTEDGMVLELDSTRDCCAWFDPTISRLNLEAYGNVITRVEEVHPQSSDVEDHLFDICIYSVDTEIACVEVTGSEGSGYYGSSITLKVRQIPSVEELVK